MDKVEVASGPRNIKSKRLKAALQVTSECRTTERNSWLKELFPSEGQELELCYRRRFGKSESRRYLERTARAAAVNSRRKSDHNQGRGRRSKGAVWPCPPLRMEGEERRTETGWAWLGFLGTARVSCVHETSAVCLHIIVRIPTYAERVASISESTLCTVRH